MEKFYHPILFQKRLALRCVCDESNHAISDPSFTLRSSTGYSGINYWCNKDGAPCRKEEQRLDVSLKCCFYRIM